MTTAGQTLARARPLALLTLASRVIGVLRECLLGYYFGTGELLSAFRIAFMLPNLARRLFGEGALSAAAIPVLTDTLHQRGVSDARAFAGALLVRLTTVLVGLVVVAELVILVARLFVQDTALTLAAYLMPYMAMICVVAVAGGMLNVLDRFVVPALAPIILNCAIVTAICLGAQLLGLQGHQLMILVCVAVLLAGLLQLGLLGAALRWAGFWPRFRGGRDPDVTRVMTLMVPMMLGLSAVQINALGDYVIAYVFIREEGVRLGPAVLGFAQYLYQLPLGVFGIALATAIFPALSRRASTGDLTGVGNVLQRGIHLTLFVALPATAGLMFVAHPLVAALYERGQFDPQSTQRVAATLRMYSLGLPAFFANHLIVRAFYAIKDSKTPARVSMVMVATNLALNLVLVLPMQERGLALATSVCAYLQAIWLVVALANRVPGVSIVKSASVAWRPCIATAAMVAILWVARGWWMANSTVGASTMLQLAIAVPLGATTYAAAAWALKITELRLVLSRTATLESLKD